MSFLRTFSDLVSYTDCLPPTVHAVPKTPQSNPPPRPELTLTPESPALCRFPSIDKQLSGLGFVESDFLEFEFVECEGVGRDLFGCGGTSETTVMQASDVEDILSSPLFLDVFDSPALSDLTLTPTTDGVSDAEVEALLACSSPLFFTPDVAANGGVDDTELMMLTPTVESPFLEDGWGVVGDDAAWFLPTAAEEAAVDTSVFATEQQQQQVRDSSEEIEVDKTETSLSVQPTYTTKTTLHERRRRTTKVYCCDHPGCTKTFTRRYNLKSHMETHNPNRIKHHSCAHCPKRFSRAHDLTRHLMLHSGEREFGCEDALRKHLAAVHDIKDEEEVL
ncbi:hypothetical protein HK104_007415 [Borealophlyctis nickersoniae]|nr:hypothetical protein HK104_007415 [Borealophlyctis nickersoniae]